MSEKLRKRGRPTSIDTDAAMHSMMEVFRAKGFAAVSLDELSDATGLSRPSLYRSFGDKLSMYMGALDAFGEQVRTLAVPALVEEPNLQIALTNFYKEMLTIYYRDTSIEPGCLIYGTAPSSADTPEIKAHLDTSIEQLDDAMRERIKRSSPNSKDGEIEMAVAIASNTLIAFSARAKSGASKNELSVMGAQSAQAICSLLGVQ